MFFRLAHMGDLTPAHHSDTQLFLDNQRVHVGLYAEARQVFDFVQNVPQQPAWNDALAAREIETDVVMNGIGIFSL